jgi:hypothetical protein
MGALTGLTVRLDQDIQRLTDTVAVNVSNQLAEAINEKLLKDVCHQLFGTADFESVRDTFEVLRRDNDIQNRVLAIRAARRMGVK